VSVAAASFAEAADLSPLRPEDRISVTVLREPDLSAGDLRIAQDGTIAVPSLGSLPAAGLTPSQLAAEIERRLAASLVRPQVAVNVVAYDSHTVTVGGSVNQPGIYSFQSNTTLLGAVSLARGTNRVAALDRVVIFRTVDGTRNVAVFDLREVQAGRMIDPVLYPGDRVVVGLSSLSQAWQDALQALPAAALFTRF
jgi:polysaccharide export outer membrane protein